MQWLRLYGEFATDPKVQMMSEAMQRRLVMLFCLRCNGDVTLHDEEVTFMLRVTPEQWQETKQLFVAKGFINEKNEVLNWDKRQYKSDSSAERVSKHRAKKKSETKCNSYRNVTETPPDTDTEQSESRTEPEERRADAADFAFVGKVIRLRHQDYAAWRGRFTALLDFDEELRSLDDYYAANGGDRWFQRASASLSKKHMERLEKRRIYGPKPPGGQPG